jgi:hypothetical protein
LDDEVVHVEVFSRCVSAVCEGVDGVIGAGAAPGVPFVSSEAPVVFGVYEGEEVAGERYSAEWVTVAEAAEDEQQGGEVVFEEDLDCEEEVLDFLSPALALCGSLCAAGPREPDSEGRRVRGGAPEGMMPLHNWMNLRVWCENSGVFRGQRVCKFLRGME